MRRAFRVGGPRAALVALGLLLATVGSAFALTAHHGQAAASHPTAPLTRTARATRGPRVSERSRVRGRHLTNSDGVYCKTGHVSNRLDVYCDNAVAHIGGVKFRGSTASVPVKCTGTGTCVIDVSTSVTEKFVAGKLLAESARAGGHHHKKTRRKHKKHHRDHKRKKHHKRHPKKHKKAKHGKKVRYVTKTVSSKVKVKSGKTSAILVALSHHERALLHKLGTLKVKFVARPVKGTHGTGVQETLVFKFQK